MLKSDLSEPVINFN